MGELTSEQKKKKFIEKAKENKKRFDIHFKLRKKVFREIDGKKLKFDVDLRSNKIFTSPVYYLQQNDLVYVDQNKSSSQDAAFNRNTGLFVSIGSIIVSLIAVLTR